MTGARCLAGGTAAATREGRRLAAACSPQRIHFLAERREHWAWTRLGLHHPERRAAADALSALMVPDDHPLWQQRLIDGGRACIAAGLRALVGEGRAR